MHDTRIYPLLEISRDELARLAGGPVTEVQLLTGGFTNTLHRVTRRGERLVIKHYAGGDEAYAFELATLRALGGVLPVPEVVNADPARRAIVYRFLDGITLDDCRRREPPAAFASLAGPLGRLLAWVARTAPIDPDERWDAAPLVARAQVLLAGSRARERMGNPLAAALARAYAVHGAALDWGPRCLCHHDLGFRNVLVQRAVEDRWRIAGVIDWESAGTGSPLVDVGSLFRYALRFDAAFVDAFELGYREEGALPDDWYRRARLLDAVRMIDMLDGVHELPGVYADCRMLLTKLATDLRA